MRLDLRRDGLRASPPPARNDAPAAFASSEPHPGSTNTLSAPERWPTHSNRSTTAGAHGGRRRRGTRSRRDAPLASPIADPRSNSPGSRTPPSSRTPHPSPTTAAPPRSRCTVTTCPAAACGTTATHGPKSRCGESETHAAASRPTPRAPYRPRSPHERTRRRRVRAPPPAARFSRSLRPILRVVTATIRGSRGGDGSFARGAQFAPLSRALFRILRRLEFHQRTRPRARPTRRPDRRGLWRSRRRPWGTPPRCRSPTDTRRPCPTSRRRPSPSRSTTARTLPPRRSR